MTIRVVKGQAAKKRPGRRTRGASHNPRVRSRLRSSASSTGRRAAGVSGGDDSRRQDRGRRSEENGRRGRAGRSDSGTKIKIIIGVVIGMVILIAIIAASSGGSSYSRGGRYARRSYRQAQPPPIRRGQSFRDYMNEHGVTEELKKRKARIEKFKRGQLRR